MSEAAFAAACRQPDCTAVAAEANKRRKHAGKLIDLAESRRDQTKGATATLLRSAARAAIADYLDFLTAHSIIQHEAHYDTLYLIQS